MNTFDHSDHEIKALKAEGLGASKIADQLGVARASVYRVLAA